jgi:hypothetical protein
VVAHLDEVEARLLGQHGLADELLRVEGLGGELVPDLHICPPLATCHLWSIPVG